MRIRKRTQDNQRLHFPELQATSATSHYIQQSQALLQKGAVGTRLDNGAGIPCQRRMMSGMPGCQCERVSLTPLPPGSLPPHHRKTLSSTSIAVARLRQPLRDGGCWLPMTMAACTGVCTLLRTACRLALSFSASRSAGISTRVLSLLSRIKVLPACWRLREFLSAGPPSRPSSPELVTPDVPQYGAPGVTLLVTVITFGPLCGLDVWKVLAVTGKGLLGSRSL